MKFDCGPDYNEWRKYISNWHPFFAILPRRVGTHDCRWMETIERRRAGGTYCTRWEYRAKQG